MPLPGKPKRNVFERIESIRKRGLRSMRGRIIPETLRESHARELFVRKLVIPVLKGRLGKDFLALTMFGSAQLGVRKAAENEYNTTKRRFTKIRSSDIDLSLAVPKEKFPTWEKREELEEELNKSLKLHGFSCHIMIYSELGFFDHHAGAVEQGVPFQILLGKEFLKSSGKNDKDFHVDLTQLQKNRKSFNRSKYFWRDPNNFRKKEGQ